MDQYYYELKFFLQVAWDKARQEVGAHIGLLVGAAAVVLLLWLFLLPGVKKKGY